MGQITTVAMIASVMPELMVTVLILLHVLQLALLIVVCSNGQSRRANYTKDATRSIFFDNIGKK